MLKIVREFLGSSKIKQAAREIYEVLLKSRQTHGPRIGIDIPQNNVELALVAERVMKDHPEITLVGGARNMMLVFRKDWDAGMAKDARELFGTSGLVDRSVTNRIKEEDDIKTKVDDLGKDTDGQGS